MSDRYCTICGQQLSAGDRFCPSCGTPVHRTARVPTPEADVAVPPPPTQQQQQPREAVARSKIRGRMLVLLGILLVLGAGETALGMSDISAGRTFGYKLGYGVGGAVVIVLTVAAIGLVVGGMIYLLTSVRGREVTFGEAVFSWPVVVVVGVISFFIIIA